MAVNHATVDALANAATRKIGYHEVLRVLFGEATRRVHGAVEPNFDTMPDVAKTKMVANLKDRYLFHQDKMAQITRSLRELGLAIDTTSRGTAITVDYRKRNTDRAKWKEDQERRMGKLARLRAQALIELVDLPRDEAKRYLQLLQAQLAKV